MENPNPNTNPKIYRIFGIFNSSSQFLPTSAMNLNLSGGTRLTYSEVNTQYQGRCCKIDKAKSFPGGTRITSWLKFKTKKRDSAAYSIFFGYNINIAGIVVDYTPVPYDETLIRNRTLSFLHIG